MHFKNELPKNVQSAIQRINIEFIYTYSKAWATTAF